MNVYKILVCGDRNWTDKEKIRRVLSEYSGDVLIINGGCRGADTLAREVAIELGMEVKTYYAEWDKYGRVAGPIRNQLMLDQEKPNLVIAFHSDLYHSKGTGDMIRRAHAANIHWVNYK